MSQFELCRICLKPVISFDGKGCGLLWMHAGEPPVRTNFGWTWTCDHMPRPLMAPWEAR